MSEVLFLFHPKTCCRPSWLNEFHPRPNLVFSEVAPVIPAPLHPFGIQPWLDGLHGLCFLSAPLGLGTGQQQ
jgi:hypothetical protein